MAVSPYGHLSPSAHDNKRIAALLSIASLLNDERASERALKNEPTEAADPIPAPACKDEDTLFEEPEPRSFQDPGKRLFGLLTPNSESTSPVLVESKIACANSLPLSSIQWGADYSLDVLAPRELAAIVRHWFAKGSSIIALQRVCHFRLREAICDRLKALAVYEGKNVSEEMVLAMEHCKDMARRANSDLCVATGPDVAEGTLAAFPFAQLWLPADEELLWVVFGNNVPEAWLDEVKAVTHKLCLLHDRLVALVPQLRQLVVAEHERIAKAYIAHDLTAQGLEVLAAYSNIKAVIETELQKLGPQRFTGREREYMRTAVDAEATDIQLALPFRTAEEIEQLREETAARERKTKFLSRTERLLYEARWYSSMTKGKERASRRSKGDAETQEPSRARATRACRRQVPLAEPVTKEQEPGEGPLFKKDFGRDASDEVRGVHSKQEPAAKEKGTINATRKSLGLGAPGTSEIPLRKSASRSLSPVGLQKRRRRRRIIEDSDDEEHEEPTSKPTIETSIGTTSEPTSNTTDEAPKQPLRKKTKRRQINFLLEDAQWFQSVTGDRKQVRNGAKRNRTQATTLAVDFTPEWRKQKKESKESTPEVAEVTSSDEEEENPYDPEDILNDTLIPCKGKDFFDSETLTGELLELEDTRDQLGLEVFMNNVKRYGNMPPSFPQYQYRTRAGRLVTNSDIAVRVRLLLHPEHTESFPLVAPKSNELDPVYEIQRLFQVVHGLYFPTRTSVRDLIYNEYVEPLGDAVDDDDFAQFMRVIDRWNALMVELSPHPLKVDPLVDINANVRQFLDGKNWYPRAVDLKLQVFYSSYAKPYEPGADDSHGSPYAALRPENYVELFLTLLKKAKRVSRYAIHLLLLRAYSRIVSPDTRKLCSYKGFTAEVYGELLPSFISEVFNKVNMKKGQRFYDLGSGVGNATLQAALEFGLRESGGCEIMEHALKLTQMQLDYMSKQLRVFGVRLRDTPFALQQSFVANDEVRRKCSKCDVILVNNYLFDTKLNEEVGKLLYGLKAGTKIISLRNFITPRYKSSEEKTIFDYLSVEKCEMEYEMSVSWTHNKVPYYVSTVMSKAQKRHE